jgi:hypothetical protein
MREIEFILLRELFRRGVSRDIIVNIFIRINYASCSCGLTYKNCPGCEDLIHVCDTCKPSKWTRGRQMRDIMNDDRINTPMNFYCRYCDHNYCNSCFHTAREIITKQKHVFICPNCIPHTLICDECGDKLKNNEFDDYFEHTECGALMCAKCYKYNKLHLIEGDKTMEVCKHCRKVIKIAGINRSSHKKQGRQYKYGRRNGKRGSRR